MFHTPRISGAIVIAATLCTAPAQAQNPPAREALDRIDPVVLLTQGKEVEGKSTLTVRQGEFQYFFSTAETKALFEKTPAKYEIQLGGACARMGPSAGGNPADFFVHEGKIYVFGSDECHKKFAEAPAKYLARPAAPMPAAASAIEQGRALLARSVKAVGGAERLDAVTSYVETVSQVQKRPQGDVPVTTKTMWKFPGGVRSNRTATVQGKVMTNATLFTPAGGWFIGQGRNYPMRPEGRADSERPFARHVVALLRARNDPGFKAAALPAATIDGVAVERVRILSGGIDVTLNLDATGRLHSMTFIDRNSEGAFGEFTVSYSDYRTVDGLTLPFAERGRFNGTPEESLTRTIDTIAVNVPLDASLFVIEPGI